MSFPAKKFKTSLCSSSASLAVRKDCRSNFCWILLTTLTIQVVPMWTPSFLPRLKQSIRGEKKKTCTHPIKYTSIWPSVHTQKSSLAHLEQRTHIHAHGRQGRDWSTEMLFVNSLEKCSYLGLLYSRKDKPSHLWGESLWNKTSHGSYYYPFSPRLVVAHLWCFRLGSQS